MIMKTFGGHGTFVGDIVSYDPETGCYQQVTYEDGDKEGLSRAPSRLACGDSRPRQSDAIRLAEARFFASASVDVRDFVRLEQCGLSVQSRVGSHPFS